MHKPAQEDLRLSSCMLCASILSALACIGFLNGSLAVFLMVTLNAYWSHWIANLAYDYTGLQHPITPNPQKAHSTRRMASSWAWENSVSIQDIWLAAGWSMVNTFARFYNVHISLLALQVLSVCSNCCKVPANRVIAAGF